jgi:hypothetical protein
MSTPIESLFHPKPPNGKFFEEKEILQIQSDLNFLVEENKKLAALVKQLQSEPPPVPPPAPQPFFPPPPPEPTPPTPPVQPTPPAPPTPTAPPAPPTPQPFFPSSQNVSVAPFGQEPITVHEHTKTITIIIDTNKMIYLLLFIILMIMILKK